MWSLYAGTFVAGAGIALAGTLLPGLVKSVFPARRSGLGTGLTMAAMMGLAAVAQSWQFYSALAWLAPTNESHGWTAREAGLLMAAFTGAQLVSGLAAPTLLDRVPDPRVLLVLAGLLGGGGELGVWLAPDTAPWLWAALLGGVRARDDGCRGGRHGQLLAHLGAARARHGAAGRPVPAPAARSCPGG